MTTNSLLTLNPSTKEEVEKFVADITESVVSGEVNALEVHARLVALDKATEAIRKNIRPEVMKAVDRYPEKTFRAFSCEIEKTEVGVKYDFTNCGDPSWLEAKEQETEWKKKREEREKFLKGLKGLTQICDETTGGETIEMWPPVKTSDSFIKVSLK